MRASILSASWLLLAGVKMAKADVTISENIALTVTGSPGMGEFKFTITDSTETMTQFATVTVTQPPQIVTATEMLTVTVVNSICTTTQGLLTAPPMTTTSISSPPAANTFLAQPPPPSANNNTQAMPGMPGALPPCPSCMCQCQLSVWPIAGISTGIATPVMSSSATQYVVTAGINIASSSIMSMSMSTMMSSSMFTMTTMSTISTPMTTSISTPMTTTSISTPMTTTMMSSSMVTPPPPPPPPPSSAPVFDISTYSLASAVIVSIGDGSGAFATGG